jgi:hypothetical protein
MLDYWLGDGDAVKCQWIREGIGSLIARIPRRFHQNRTWKKKAEFKRSVVATERSAGEFEDLIGTPQDSLAPQLLNTR